MDGLARRAMGDRMVRHPRWAWESGMWTVCGAVVLSAVRAHALGPGRWALVLARWSMTDDGWVLVHDYCPPLGKVLPDLGHPATRALVLERIRQLWREPGATLYAGGPHSDQWVVLGRSAPPGVHFPTEADALEAALGWTP